MVLAGASITLSNDRLPDGYAAHDVAAILDPADQGGACLRLGEADPGGWDRPRKGFAAIIRPRPPSAIADKLKGYAEQHPRPWKRSNPG